MRMPELPLGALFLTLPILVSCGGGGSGSKPKLPVTISLSPHNLTLTAGESYDFSFSLVIPGGNYTTDFGISWGCSGGTIAQAGQLPPPYEYGGHYTAPTSPGTYSVVLTSQYDSSRKDTATVTVIAAPVVTSFTASSMDLDARDPKAELTAVFTDGVATISPGVGAVQSGLPVTVRPTAGTTYTLTVTNAARTSVTRSLDLKVWDAPEVTLTASGASITREATATLGWTLRNATAATLEPGIGSVLSDRFARGQWMVAPPEDTTYTLTASNPVRTAQASVTVKVVAPPSIDAFALSPEVIHPGERAQLTVAWSGGTASLTPSVGTFGSGVPVELGPEATTTYKLRVDNGSGSQATAEHTLRMASRGAFKFAGSLASPRVNPLLALLPEGKVLVAGGGSRDLDTSGARPPLAGAEIFDPATGTSRTLSASMASARMAINPSACALALPGGAVLLMPTLYGATAEIFEPSTETFRPLRAPAPATPCLDPAQALPLPDGRILFTAFRRLYLFDPATEAFQDVAMRKERTGHALTLLGDGTVLISGGDPHTGSVLGTCERFDPATGTTTLLPGQWNTMREGHRAFLGTDGRVQLWGGKGPMDYGWGPVTRVDTVDPSDGSLTDAGLPPLAAPYPGPYAICRLADTRTLVLQTRSGILYDPAALRALPAENEAILWHHGRNGVQPFEAATLALPDGRILFAGGEAEEARRVNVFDPLGGAPGPYSGLRHPVVNPFSEFVALTDGRFLVVDGLGRLAPKLLEPTTGAITTGGPLVQPCSGMAVEPLPDGSALAFGGFSYVENVWGGGATLDLVQRFEGATGTWSAAGKLVTPRRAPTTVRLDDGKVVVLGGASTPGAAWGECFDPATGLSKAMPAPPQPFDSWFAAGQVQGGRVLVAGSGRALLFDPATFVWKNFSVTIDAAAPSFVRALPGGQAVLLRQVEGHVVDLATSTGVRYYDALDYLSNVLALGDGRFLVSGWLEYGYNDYRNALALLDPARGTSRLLPAAHGDVQAMGLMPDGRICLIHKYTATTEFLDLTGFQLP